ncbi:MAG: glycosyl hydrolase family 28 protein [Puniceicoccaceae bacterium]
MNKIYTFLWLSMGLTTLLQALTHDITSQGAIPDDDGDDTVAIQQVIDACAAAGGGTVNFPAGTWHSGTVYLRSNVSIHLENGAIWRGVNAAEAFPPIEPRVKSREDLEPRPAFLYGYRVENVRIYGSGMIAPGGEHAIWKSDRDNVRYHERPFGIHLVESKHITVEGIRMENSAFWMQRYFLCDHVRLSDLTIYNHCNLNNDGIDIDGCHDVVIDNCIIDSSDDALVLKSEGLRTVEDVVISNCILSSHATPLKLGTGSVGGYKRVAISNIVIRSSKSPKMIHVHEAWGGLSGIDLLSVDGGILQDIQIDNVIMHGVETPFFIKLGNRHSEWEGKPDATPGRVENIVISNLTARDCGPISSAITGYPGHPVRGVRLSNIDITMRGKGPAGSAMEPVPEHSNHYPFNRMFKTDLPTYGLFLRHVENLRLENVRLSYTGMEQRHALWVEQARDVVFQGLELLAPVGENSWVQLHEATDVTFRNSNATREDVSLSATSGIHFLP